MTDIETIFLIVVIYYILVVNFIAFVLYGLDKKKAIKGQWRISEATLMGIAIIGGSIGAWFGMYYFRHKTKHTKFTKGIPIILIIQILLVYFVYLSGSIISD